MDVDEVADEGEWKSTGQTLVGKGPQGEDQLFLLQRRGNALRVAPKGGKKGGIGGKKGGGANERGGLDSGNKWDPNGCARCGRSSHWTKKCTAVKDVNGEKPRGKPKKPKGGRKGCRLNDLEETDEGAQEEPEESGDAQELMADDYEEELGQLFMFEELCEPCGKGPLTFSQDPWETHDPWCCGENMSGAAKTIASHQLPILMA